MYNVTACRVDVRDLRNATFFCRYGRLGSVLYRFGGIWYFLGEGVSYVGFLRWWGPSFPEFISRAFQSARAHVCAKGEGAEGVAWEGHPLT